MLCYGYDSRDVASSMNNSENKIVRWQISPVNKNEESIFTRKKVANLFIWNIYNNMSALVIRDRARDV
jgi:hypothetical protein